MDERIKRSPFFYVGDKYKLVPQLKKLMPDNIDTYIEPFVGGGSSAMNTKACKYLLNDIDENVIRLHHFLELYKNDRINLYKKIFECIEYYQLSCSLDYTKVIPKELKQKYKKTYFSKYNKSSYLKMRDDFNQNNEDILLYLLLIYGFNHMIRFNKEGKFNLPVGNVDFNKNVFTSITYYLDFVRANQVEFSCLDYKEFIEKINIKEGDYIYFDPPYLISQSEYNKLWNNEKEIELLALIDELDKKGIRFGITNLIYHKGHENNIFKSWAQNYYIYDIHSNYISYHDNTIKKTSQEVFVTNYGKC